MKSTFSCKICGNTSDNNTFIAKERMLNTKHEFEYLECGNCKCLQIIKIPETIGNYYPQNYYSFKEPRFNTKLTPLRYFIRKQMTKYYIGNFSISGHFISFFYSHPFPWIKRKMVGFKSRILDIGCGNGRLLLSMQRSGFKNLTGVDPYINKDIHNNNVNIYKKDIYNLNEQYDLIMLNHSFEHMEDPQKVMIKLNEIVSEKGHILIRIPVANSYAWRKYNTFWLHLDAPRHYYIHTIPSMEVLAKNSGLKINDIIFESSDFSFTESEKYLRNIEFNSDNKIFSKKKIKAFKKEAKRLNAINDGDTACFYLTKIQLKDQ